MNSVRAKGRDAKRVSEVKQMQTALEAYFSNSASASYPVLGIDAAPATLGTGNQIKLCNTALGFDTAANCDNAANAPVFMARAPRDPSNGAQIGGASYEYTYKSRTAANADCPAAPCPHMRLDFALRAAPVAWRAEHEPQPRMDYNKILFKYPVLSITYSDESPPTAGFTLVELLVAVGIIGVLASVSMVSVNSIRVKARDSKRISDIKQVQNALEAYYSSNNLYPSATVAVATGLGSANFDVLCNSGAGVCCGHNGCKLQRSKRSSVHGAY